jgi:hypothetical protein
MRSGKCARAGEMTATAMKTANVNAAATAAVTAALRAGISRSRQQYCASQRDHA